MNTMMLGGFGVKGGGGLAICGAPNMHIMSNLIIARHVHGILGHVHWNSHCGVVMSWGEFWLHALISV